MAETLHMKSSSLGLIPNDWEVFSLGELGDVKMCKRVMKHQTQSSGEIPFFKIGTFGGTPDAYISRELFSDFRSRFSYPKKGDILLSAAGTIGRTVVFDGQDAYFQDSNIVWIDNKENKVLNCFLYYSYKVMRFHTENGGIVVRLYNENLRNTTFAAPKSLDEQKRIADALSGVDKLIDSLDEAIAKKQQIKEGLMQQLLTGKTRLPRFRGEWKEVRLGDIFDFYKGTGLSKADIDFTGNNRCILYGEIFTKYDIEVKGDISRTYCSIGTPSVKGDLLMPGSTTTVGIDLVKAVFVNDDNIQLGGDIIILRKKEQVDSAFFAMLISNVSRNAVAEKTQGTTIIHLHGKNLTDIRYYVPESEQEQNEISKINSKADADIEEHLYKKNKLLLLKQGMMQELLTGKTRLI